MHEGERLLADRVLDASYDAIRVRALVVPPLGTKVRVSMRMPGSRVWVDADGTVSRVIHGRRSGDDSASFAIHLRRMDGMQRLLLSTVAQMYPEAAGGRGDTRDYAKAIERIGTDD